MPVQTAKKTLVKARRAIRKHWSEAEVTRRREAAEQMQQRLVEMLIMRPTAPR